MMRLYFAAAFILALSLHRHACALVLPIEESIIASGFGPRRHPVLHRTMGHSGVDIPAPRGSSIRAIGPGVVIYAGPLGAYGNFIVLRHGKGVTSHYGHCDSLLAALGDTVVAGQTIATVGVTGRVTGPHLHFELRVNGIAVDPEKYLPGLSSAAEG